MEGITEGLCGCRERVPNPGQARGLAGWKRTCWHPDEIETSMKITKALFGILTATLAVLLRARVALLGLMVGLCFLTACASKRSDEVTGMGSSGAAARQDAIYALDRKYASYEIVDENGSDWVSGTAQHQDPDSVSLTQGKITEAVRTYKCTIRVKNAVPRKEGDTTTQSERATQASEAAQAKTEKKQSEAVSRASDSATLTSTQQNITRAMGSLAFVTTGLYEADSLEDVENLLMTVPPAFLQAGNDCDLQIIRKSPNSNPDPVAYVLFNKDDFVKGINVSEKTVDAFLPLLTSGYNEGVQAQEQTPDSPRVTRLNRGGGKKLTSCSAIGWALIRGQNLGGEFTHRKLQGFSLFAVENQCAFALIETGSPLQESIKGAAYHANVFASASLRAAQFAKTFVGKWKNPRSPTDPILEIRPDYSYSCGEKAGTYYVPITNHLLFLEAGKKSGQAYIDHGRLRSSFGVDAKTLLE